MALLRRGTSKSLDNSGGRADAPLQERRISPRKDIKRLKEHLKRENPLLVEALESLQSLDSAARKVGLLSSDETYARYIAWWPLISVLGPYSAGKSSFLNHFLGFPLQETGSQAVDDKFTVVCYASDGKARSLPGSALDADPRFPFYKMSEELEKVEPGEGMRVDAYLQLKTCPADKLKGMILIDSPGFDADAQRTSTLRITDYIIDLSDLVLVLFDARRPEPGAMRDTLEHLVKRTVKRKDAAKFLYILNQIDLTAREDNPEEVVGAWQRAIAQAGLTAGRFFRIYNEDCAAPIVDPALRERFQRKRDKDMAEITGRMAQVRVERAYRIVGAVKKIALEIRDAELSRLASLRARWRRGVFIRDGFFLGGLAAVVIAILILGMTSGSNGVSAGWWRWLWSDWWQPSVLAALVLGAGGWLHFKARAMAGRALDAKLENEEKDPEHRHRMRTALRHNMKPWHSVLHPAPAGLKPKVVDTLNRVIEEAEGLVQKLNDTYADPTGERAMQREMQEKSGDSCG